MAATADGDEYTVGKARADGSAMGRDTLQKLIKLTLIAGSTRSTHRFGTAEGRPRGGPLYPTVDHPCYSPDGRLFAACRTQAKKGGFGQPMVVAAWERATGRPVLPWTAVRQFIHSLAFSPNGEILAVGEVAGIWLVDVAARRPPRFLVQPGPITRLEFSPEGRRLAAGVRSGWGAQPGVQLWDVATGTPVGPALSTGALPYFQFAPDGRLLVLDTASRRLVSLDAETGRPIAHPVTLPGLDADVMATDSSRTSPLSLAVAFRPDGGAVVESPTTSTARQYEVDSGRPIGPAMNHGDLIGWLAYSPDGSTLASTCPDGTVRLWDAPTGSPLGAALVHGLPALGVFFSPDGARLNVVTVDGRSTSWPVPRPQGPDDPTQLRLRAEVISGLRSAEGDEVADLSLEAWRHACEQLRQTWPEALPSQNSRQGLQHWHRDRADDARRIGDDDAYRHHLERLADLDPTDWLPVAERAASLAEVGRSDEAAATYAHVARLAKPDDLSSWLWYCGVKNLASGRPAAALWHLDRAALARPDDWSVHAHRAEALESIGRRTEAVAEQERATVLDADPSYIAEIAGDRAGQGDWPVAWRLMNLAVTRGAGDRADQGLICLRQGDRDGYRRACDSILSAIPAGPVRLDAALEAAWLIGLGPDAVRDYARPLELADSALVLVAALVGREKENEVRDLEHQAHQNRAAVLLRAGRTDEALASLAKASALADSNPSDNLLAAIAHARSGQVAEAKARLDKARATIIAERGKSKPWQRTAELEVLEAEAESALLDRVFPDQPFAGPREDSAQ
jgi:Flp pilus assembly protein TadD